MNLPQYAKAASSAATNLVAWGTETAALLELVPDKRTAGIASALLLIVHAVGTFSVWLTKNQSVIDADVTAVEKVVAAARDWSGTSAELQAFARQLLAAITGAPAAVTSADPAAERRV